MSSRHGSEKKFFTLRWNFRGHIALLKCKNKIIIGVMSKVNYIALSVCAFVVVVHFVFKSSKSCAQIYLAKVAQLVLSRL